MTNNNNHTLDRVQRQFLFPIFSLTRGAGGSAPGSEKIAALEQKLFKLQEEVTELHRQKGEVIHHEIHNK